MLFFLFIGILYLKKYVFLQLRNQYQSVTNEKIEGFPIHFVKKY